MGTQEMFTDVNLFRPSRVDAVILGLTPVLAELTFHSSIAGKKVSFLAGDGNSSFFFLLR